MMQSNQQLKDKVVKALAVIGFVAILIIGLLGIARAVYFMPNVFAVLQAAAVTLSSVFVPAEELELSVPTASPRVGEVFTLSWSHTGGSENGSYTVTYPCVDDFYFEAESGSGSYTETFCDTPFNFTDSKDSIRLIPISENNRFLDVEVTVAFTPEGEEGPVVEASTLLTIVNESVSDSPATTGGEDTDAGDTTSDTTGSTERTPGDETTNTYLLGGGNATSDPNGYIDLVPSVLEIGYVDKDTNIFTAENPVTIYGESADKRVAVRFSVENAGTKDSGAWAFNAVLPTYPSHIFHSNTQQSLGPGDRLEFTIGFDKIDTSESEGEIIINIDPTRGINESNKTNNILKTDIPIVVALP